MPGPVLTPPHLCFYLIFSKSKRQVFLLHSFYKMSRDLKMFNELVIQGHSENQSSHDLNVGLGDSSTNNPHGL